jgi:hypothetical protein
MALMGQGDGGLGMTLVFDAATVPFSGYIMLLVPAATLLVMFYNLVRGGQRKWVFIMGGVTVFLFLMFFVLPLADFYHVKAALADGSARTVDGIISMHKRETTKRWTGSARGVGVTSYSSYTTSTSEQFYVGQQWFWLRVGGMPSNASFTNAKDPPLPLRDGTRVRVTFFEDPWNGNETRILRLEIDEVSARRAAAGALNVAVAAASEAAPAAQSAAASPPFLPADFNAFWKRFSAAAASGDSAGVKALTRFPFLFAGTELDATRFDGIWMGIFPTPLRPCFGTASPIKDGESFSVSCGPYVYVFNKGAKGWQFTDFAADPEAME